MSTEDKTPIQLVLDAFDNSGRSGFAEWLSDNREKLLKLESNLQRQAYIRAIQNYGVPPLPKEDTEFSMHQHWKEDEGDNHSGTIKHFQD